MSEFLMGHYGYWFIFLLVTLGFYGMVVKRNLVKKVIGLTIFQVSIIMFYLATAVKTGGTIPIYTEALGAADPARYINPLQHTLMLTAIVVGVATSGVAYALLISIWRRYRTLDEADLLHRMAQDADPE